jgi:hypothetical protein
LQFLYTGALKSFKDQRTPAIQYNIQTGEVKKVGRSYNLSRLIKERSYYSLIAFG